MMFHEIEDLMKKNNNGGNVVDDENNGSNGNRLSRWHNNSSRIIRVSRASGGKDRHSKVWTSKGPRDRRVRLSVSTALQFYDLQDRLGYDQPSKAIEWLIKAAEDSISELPILNTTFPNDQETLQNQTIATTNTTNSMSKSGCSSNSDTSKNSSGLSLSRSELRDKARERARERTAKETKERHDDNYHQDNHHHDHHHHHHTSFTELLTAGRQWITTSPTSSTHQHPPMEYLSTSGLIDQNSFQTFMSDDDHHQHHDQHQELSFVPEHLISPGSGGGGFNLDFNMSTSSSNVVAATTNGFSGYNRGTLQSNSTNHQSFLTNLQRYNTSSQNGNGNGGGGAQFLFGALPVDNHNQHPHQFQLYYENGCRNSDQKGKGKN